MNFARERLEIEEDFRMNIEEIERSTREALENILNQLHLYITNLIAFSILLEDQLAGSKKDSSITS